MTETEFRTWLKSFYALFRSVETYHERLGDKRGETLRAWFDCLSLVSFEHATEAARRLFSGDEEEPKNFDLFPGAIRRIAGRLASEQRRILLPTTRYQAVHEPPKFRCPKCQDRDSAAAEIYDREAMRLVYSHEARVRRFNRFDWFDGQTWRDLFNHEGVPVEFQVMVHNTLTPTCTVLCQCDAAMSKVTHCQRNNKPVPLSLDEGVMFCTLFKPRDRMQEFGDWVEENAVSIQTGAVDWTAQQEAF